MNGPPGYSPPNSAMAMLDREHPGIGYVETRDADDELGSDGFLRQTVGQLEHDPRLAFVQTIKEAQVSPGDPFNNRESMFYRGQMLARNAANAVFPCGSGVVWRRRALDDIGHFPTWNLVEDLHSGVEALRRGWHGMYLPIVGAVGQHSPEDVPNVYKQRGTWAIDTVRLMVWGDLKGLGLRQRLQFAEMLLFYLNAFTVLVYVPSIACSLLGWTPLDATGTGYLGHMLPLVLATELWMLAVNHPFFDRRQRQRRPIRALWQVAYALGHRTLPSASLLAGALYWGGMNIILLSGFVTRSRHGLRRVRGAFREELWGAVTSSAGARPPLGPSIRAPRRPRRR